MSFTSCAFSPSAGVGRTGTFITIDHILEQVGREGVVDIPGAITKIRDQRTNMVQTLVSGARSGCRMSAIYVYLL